MSATSVVAASRAFVCVRPQTYEDASEGEFLKHVFTGRNGLQNTTFALLSPDGRKLDRGSRSPMMAYGDASSLTKALLGTAEAYAKQPKAIRALPVVRTLRLGLNVAAADMRPLVILRAKDSRGAERLKQKMAKLAWSEALVGQCHYVVLGEAEEFGGLAPEVGISLVRPDPFGRGGAVPTHAPLGTSTAKLKTWLVDAVSAYQVGSRRHRDHIREGRRRGIHWQPGLEDPGKEPPSAVDPEPNKPDSAGAEAGK